MLVVCVKGSGKDRARRLRGKTDREEEREKREDGPAPTTNARNTTVEMCKMLSCINFRYILGLCNYVQQFGGVVHLNTRKTLSS